MLLALEDLAQRQGGPNSGIGANFTLFPNGI
jgi:hypothetical protein